MDDASIDALMDSITKLESEGEPSKNLPPVIPQLDLSPMRERLIGVVAGGNSKEYLGKNITVAEIESMEEKALLKIYSRYDAYIGNVMAKSVKSALCSAYANAVGLLAPILSNNKLVLRNCEELTKKLINNPVINIALSTYSCTLYHKYGHYLAPLTATLLTSGYIHRGDCNPTIPEQSEDNGKVKSLESQKEK